MESLPKLRPWGGATTFVDTFRGYDHNHKIPQGAWYDQENMTGADYPALATRRPRRMIRSLDRPAGCIARDALAVVEGTRVVYNGTAVELDLRTDPAACPKQLVSMGAYLVIWPDKKYLNTADLSDFGSLEHTAALTDPVTVTLATADGADYTDYAAGPEAPAEPENGALWLDTSDGAGAVLRVYSTETTLWSAVADTYLKFSGPNIGKGFSLYDGVTFSGLTGALAAWNGDHVLYGVGDHYLTVTGVLDRLPLTHEGITVRRTVPDMDFITECDNRLWGCKYGLVNGKAVNEIYASKLGDFRNWHCHMGLSTDSYAAGRGADGVFTGAITYLGHPLFFREDCIEKVYPSATGAHRIVTTEGRGVQKGCWRSLAIVGETLYYKSRDGVCAYRGALPSCVSEALGEEIYDDARAGAAGELYYLSLRRSDGAWHLFTYDTARRLWHRQDHTRAQMFAAVDGEMVWIDEDRNALMGANGDREDNFTWSVTSGVIGYDLAENEYISHFVIRCDTHGTLRLEISYDEGGAWVDRGRCTGRGLGSFLLPVAPRRCDHLRIRLSGEGPCRIWSIAKTVRRGSDVFVIR